MDRNMRYRQCGSACGNSREVGNRKSADNSCCLCTSQPISLAMAYVKDQPFEKLFSLSEAICHGTLFCELYMPYNAGGKRR